MDMDMNKLENLMVLAGYDVTRNAAFRGAQELVVTGKDFSAVIAMGVKSGRILRTSVVFHGNRGAFTGSDAKTKEMIIKILLSCPCWFCFNDNI